MKRSEKRGKKKSDLKDPHKKNMRIKKSGQNLKNGPWAEWLSNQGLKVYLVFLFLLLGYLF